MKIYTMGLLIANAFFLIASMELSINNKESLDKQLIEAFSQENIDLAEIKNLISSGADVNAKIYGKPEFFEKYFMEANNPFSAYLLHKVVTLGNADTIQVLIDAGADVNARDTHNLTPLSWALEAKVSPDIIKLLINHNADVNTKDINNLTPLSWAIQAGASLDMVKLLIEQGAEVDAGVDIDFNLDSDIFYPLHLAIKRGNLDIVKLLVDNGADLNFEGHGGRSALNIADEFLQFDILRFFIGQSSCLNKSPYGDTSLHWAARSGDIDSVKYCVQNNVYINARDDYGDTPLHHAVDGAYRSPAQANIEVVNFLIGNDAEVNNKNKYGDTPLHIATKAEFTDIVSLLLNKGADITATNNFGDTPLHSAFKFNYDNEPSCNTDIVKILLSWFTLPQVKLQTTTFINKMDNEEVWDLNSLALMNLLKNSVNYDEDSYKQVASLLAERPPLLNEIEKIMPFINLKEERIRQLITSNSLALMNFSKEQHFEHLKNFIAMRNSNNQTALDIALRNILSPNSCAQLLQAVANAQEIDDLPDDLIVMIEENIKKIFPPSENANVEQDLIESDDKSSKKRKVTQIVDVQDSSTAKKRKLNPLEDVQDNSDGE